MGQPPSGGCVLKPPKIGDDGKLYQSAAFGRLCVETADYNKSPGNAHSAAFGRLCVETTCAGVGSPLSCSAAFGRLCVETIACCPRTTLTAQPPSGGCVLKLLNGMLR